MVFPVVMYGYKSWTIKKAEHWRIDAFELWCWRRLLRVPWTARRSNPSILKEISLGCSLEGLMLKLKLQYFGHQMRRSDSFEKTLMLGKIQAVGEVDDRGWDGWMASPTQWTWVWVDSRSWWWTGRPGVLRFMGLQRVGHDWATELNWTEFTLIHGPNIPGSYVILLFTALDVTSITSHIHNWVLFLLWLRLFLLSGVISPLISSSILGTYRSGKFIFQCPIFLPFHTVRGVLKARILKWFAFPFSSGPHFSELSTVTHPSWVALHIMAHSFIELDKAVVHVIRLVTFLWLWISFCLPSDG